MKYLAILINTFFVFFFTQNFCLAQWYNPDKLPKKAKKIFEDAYKMAEDGNYEASITYLNNAITEYSNYVDAHIALGGIYSQKRNYKAAIINYEKAIQLDSVYSKDILLPYSVSLAGVGNFEKALNIVNKFIAEPTIGERDKKAGMSKKDTYVRAIEMSKKNFGENYIFNPINLGDSINTSYLEYFPTITIDGRKMIFNRRINGDEDFYESDFENNSWTNAKPIAGKINTNLNEGAQNISQDGEWLVFTGCDYPEGRGSCDLYISYKTKNGKWSEAQNIGSNINSEYWESSPSISPDKQYLYFSSNRLGGYGGKDIWVSKRGINGDWELPKNMGPTINTSGDENYPFIHADNSTFYFGSNGLPGYGLTDLYICKKNDYGVWSTPLNLGYPINTIDDEGSLIVSANGKLGFYASDVGNASKGGIDIYQFDLPKNLQATNTIWVKGKVFDKKTNEGLASVIELKNINTSNLVSLLKSDNDGNYMITLPIGKEYAFNVSKKGYLFSSKNFSLGQNISDSSMQIDIALQPIEKGASVVLNNIFFDTKKSELKPTSIVELDKIIEFLKENSLTKISIIGYTDNVGKPADNIILSNERAKAVLQYLKNKNISPDRLQAKGLGEANPIELNNTEECRMKNRRTELVIL